MRQREPQVVAELESTFEGWIAKMAEPLGNQAKEWKAGEATAKKGKRKMTKEEKDAAREKEREKRRSEKKPKP